ncbi:hypothetical protein QYE76_030923 [Lolium multiflorum]|uniref:F-box domain-containing protein n=1 Tax=Lolium multiflorum TaxID=4521 RepID=A0AAD8VJP8_LOLMU|nr:hypothetical protein QYE76_030923 [Lolium multiflorum]
MAAATAMDGEGWKFPAAPDVLVEILMRLPPSCRRLLRLVCRTWRDVVDQRTPEMRSRAAILVQTERSSYVVDDLSSGRRRELWTGRRAGDRYGSMCVVGTCNGLLCLCDTKEPGGAITLANPATGETLLLPLLPFSGQYYRPFRWGDGGIATSRHEAYCFGTCRRLGSTGSCTSPATPTPPGSSRRCRCSLWGRNHGGMCRLPA